jgi:hypothetical protein
VREEVAPRLGILGAFRVETVAAREELVIAEAASHLVG